MSTIDWPQAITPAECQLVLRKSGRQFTSPFNGTTQAVDDIAERWVLSVTLPASAPGNGLQSFCSQLAGGVNRVRAWHFGTRGQPRGTLRGTPTLAGAAARGNASITLAGAYPGGVLTQRDFSVDSNSDLVSDGCVAYSGGTVAGLVYGLPGGPWGVAQRVAASSMGGTSASQAGIEISPSIAVQAGQQISISAQIFGYVSTQRIQVLFYTSAGVGVPGSAMADWIGGGFGYDLRSLTVTVPAGAQVMRLWVYMHSATAASPEIRVDQLQVEIGAAPTAFNPAPATLLADDMIGVGGHLLQVAADCTASAGTLLVPIVNRIRGAIAAGSAVTWYRPTADFILPAMQAGPVWQPGGIMQATALDLVEVYTP